MSSFIDFFADISTAYRTGLLVGGFVFFWMLEGLVPLFRFEYRKWRHALVNLFFWVTTLAVNFGMAFLLVLASDFAVANHVGVLQFLEWPLWLEVLAGVILLDLVGAYFIHWLEHRVRWMWKFHLIHHSDTSVDITTGLRHHPGESVFRATFTAVAIFLVGAPAGIVLFYQSLSAVFAQLTHANIRMPKRLDQALSYVLVTPNMHKVHHHFTRPLTDTNYGNIFSIWDRLFGTFAQVEAGQLQYGIDTHMAPSENEAIGNLLAIPFQAYRPPPEAKFGTSDSREAKPDSD
jgi:sterol desaturase/sphingolipid hydroxylase (fatty acid hydroxylase superfamily)